jgi:hypothetical protein
MLIEHKEEFINNVVFIIFKECMIDIDIIGSIFSEFGDIEVLN